MKKLVLTFSLLIALFSCQNDPKGFEINGTIDGVENGKKVTLQAIKDNRPVSIDTTEITDGKFSLKGSVENADIHLLLVQNVRGNLPFILGNEKMDMTLYKDSLPMSIISGSKDNDVAQAFTKGVYKFKKQNDSLRVQYRTAQKNKDTAFLKGFNNKMQDLRKQNKDYNLDFIENNKNSLFTMLLLENLQGSRAVDVDKANEIFNEFPKDIQESASGKRLKKNIDAALATKEGSIAPDFTAPDPEGNDITLSKIKGKITIIDFWAAWCGPCRKENPNIVKVYNKYHDKGLEIIGVSLDGNPRQKDAKQEWLDAIEKDGLTWHQVSNLKYFNGPIAKNYNIRSIPAMFVLDEEGKIIAKNLRGPALEQKISELLD